MFLLAGAVDHVWPSIFTPPRLLPQTEQDRPERSTSLGRSSSGAQIADDLAAMSQERDAVRQELENFITLRDRVGIQLLDFRGNTLVVVPESARIRRWQADELSEVAHLNGRMYRLSD